MSETNRRFGKKSSGKTKRKPKPMRVTLVSGFLGSGKTSLLSHILTNKDHNMKCAVIVNEISEFNIDALAIEGANFLQSDEKMVEMSNGCICCTLREDLLEQLHELATKGYDAALIESSGISEPMQVAETFFFPHTAPGADKNSQPLMLQHLTPLDNCVTVVDAGNLMQHMQSIDSISAIDKRAEETEDKRNIASLMFDQLEFANVILLNKVDTLEQAAASAGKDKEDVTVEKLTKLINKVNPHAEVIPTTKSQVPLNKLINTGNFTEEFTQKTQGWMDTCKDGLRPETTETEEYGVSAMSFTPKVAFHPQRLHDWMHKYFNVDEAVHAEEDEDGETKCALSAAKKPELSAAEKAEQEAKQAAWGKVIKSRAEVRVARYGNLFRGKGFAWVGSPSKSHVFASWGQAGNTLGFGGAGSWEEFPQNDAPEPVAVEPGQRLVFIGQDLKKDALKADLEAILLTSEEQDQLKTALAIELEDGQLDVDRPDIFPDPWAPFEKPHMHDHDHAHEGDDEEEEEEDEEEEEEEEEEAEAAVGQKRGPSREDAEAAPPSKKARKN